MEDFLYLLAIAIVILAVVGVITMFFPGAPPAEYIKISEFSGGYLGFTNQASRSINLGSFSVGEPQAENLRTVPQMQVSSSWLGSERKSYDIGVEDWYATTQRGVRVSFDLTESNAYGNLIIKWNGKEFFSEIAEPRHYSVFINSSYVKSSNKIEILSDGPGFYFWASTVYVLKNVNINLEYGPEKIVAFELVPDEISMFDRGELDFYASGTGDLEIKVNGVGIYEESPRGNVKVSFDYLRVPLRAGGNLITFIDREGVYSLNDAVFNMFLLNNQSVLMREFNLTQANFDLLDKGIMKGRIDYTVNSIARQGVIKMEINSKTIGSFTPEMGSNSAEFGPANAQLGENDIKFSSMGGYQLSDIVVGLAA
jgi:hypothetical protein